MALLRGVLISPGVSRDGRWVSTASIRARHSGRPLASAALFALLLEAAARPDGRSGGGGGRATTVDGGRHFQFAFASVGVGVNAGRSVGRRQSLYGRSNDA